MIRRLLGPFREFGLGAGALYIVDRVLGLLSPRCRLHCYELVAQPVGAGPLLPQNMRRNLQVREIGEGDSELATMPVPAAVIAARFRQGATCLGAWQREQFVAYGWFCPDHYEEDEVRCTYVLEPPGRAVFDFDIYVFPERRLGLAFTGLWHGANEHLQQRGIETSFSRVSRFNLASRRAHGRLGARVIGRALFLKLRRFELMLANVSPYFSMSLRGRPRLLLRDKFHPR